MPKAMAQFRILLGPGAVLPPLPPADQQRLLRDLGVMTQEMRLAAGEGVACIVDAGHPDMGRNFQFLKQLSLKSGMPIVAGAGYYTQPFYPPEIARWDEDEIARELVRQVKAEAIGAYGEIGTWDAMTPDERKVLRAVGKAHLATNLPIFTHTNMGKGADSDSLPPVMALLEAGYADKPASHRACCMRFSWTIRADFWRSSRRRAEVREHGHAPPALSTAGEAEVDS